MAAGYVRDTGILTATREVAVQDLRAGDMLVTRLGVLRALKWVGRRSYNGLFLGQTQAPVCFHAGSIAENVPHRNLYVSPAHAMVVMNRLVDARLLVNDKTVTQTATSAQVDYFHLDLGVHDCLITEGAWSESYAEQNNRTQFHNLAEFRVNFPRHVDQVTSRCLPQLHFDDPALADIRAALLARVATENFSHDAAVHLMADGVRIEAARRDVDAWMFMVPAQANEVRLMSHATAPASLGAGDDVRRLGVCVSAILIESSCIRITVQADHPRFSTGVHAVETSAEGMSRWTDGNCRLPAGIFMCFPPGEMVSVTVRGKTLKQYLVGLREAIH